MIDFYEKRYPYSHTKEHLITMLTNFEVAEEDFDPICLRRKHWELVKLDFEEIIRKEFN